MEPRLSIVIPCYNEEENIPLILTQLKRITTCRKDIEIVLVNNGSTDNSKKLFDKELKEDGCKSIKLVNVARNQGYGHGILTGLNESKGQLLSWTHADMQTNPLDVLKALDSYVNSEKKSIVIKGKRKNRKLLESFFTFGMQLAVFFILRTYLDDINAQPKLFSKEFYDKYIRNEAPLDFSLDLYLLYQAKMRQYKILEIPVYFGDRIYGEASGGSGSWKPRIKLIKRTFKYILGLRKVIGNMK
ncbi:hypothetical protein S1OALGB6SA_176 [Olavius algarvensis spirochete endosymbiont]|nr:hypothetical protein S1OALGB6SA_176 [Olavius algarvensis spirochete endosymbiont]